MNLWHKLRSAAARAVNWFEERIGLGGERERVEREYVEVEREHVEVEREYTGGDYGAVDEYGEADYWEQESEIEREIEEILMLDDEGERLQEFERLYERTGDDEVREWLEMQRAEMEAVAEETLQAIDAWDAFEALLDRLKFASTFEEAQQIADEIARLGADSGIPEIERFGEQAFYEALRSEERFAGVTDEGIAWLEKDTEGGQFRHAFSSEGEAMEWVRAIPGGEVIFAVLPVAYDREGNRYTPGSLGLSVEEFKKWARESKARLSWEVYDVYS